MINITKYSRVYESKVKEYSKLAGLGSSALIFVLFVYLSSINAITITGYSGDIKCAGTESDPCYAYINFTAQRDIFIYPINDTTWMFNTEPKIKSIIMQRKWGNSWRIIDLSKPCNGAWCGCYWCTKNKTAKYAYVFRSGKTYQLRFIGYKYSPYDNVKWGFADIDPIWYGINLVEHVKDDISLTHACSYYKLNYYQTGIAKNQKFLDFSNKLSTLRINSVKQVFGRLTELNLEVKVKYNITTTVPNCTRIKNGTIATENGTIVPQYISVCTNKTVQKEVWKWVPLYSAEWNKKYTRYAKPDKVHSHSLSNNEVKNIYSIFSKKNSVEFRICGDYIPDYTDNGAIIAIDHIPEFDSLTFKKFTWWNASWPYKRPITIDNTGNSNSLTDYQVKVELDSSNFDFSKANSDGSDIRFLESFLENYTYKVPITIDNSNNNEELTNYQVKIELDSSNFDFSHAKSDGGDIRFFDSDGSTKLNYWIEDWDSSSQEAIVWVKVPSIPASSTKTIYMYYGNPSATSESDISATMSFFDDFSTNPSTKWTIYRYSADASNEFYWDSGAGIVYLTKATSDKGSIGFMNYQGTLDTGFHIKFKFKSGGGSGADGLAFAFYKDKSPYQTYGKCTNGGSMCLDAYDGTNKYQSNGYDVEFDNYDNGDADPSANHIAITETFSSISISDNTHYGAYNTGATEDNAWHNVEIYFDRGTNHIVVYLDSTKIIDFSGSPFSTYGYYDGFGFGAGTGGATNNHIIDEVILRKYTDPEPTTTIGEEESCDYSTYQELPYWIEDWDSSGQEATIWVKVPSIPASSTKTIYMYYGNENATSESNGTAVFDFYDDFTTYDSTKYEFLKSWDDSTRAVSVENGMLKDTDIGGGDDPYMHTVNGIQAGNYAIDIYLHDVSPKNVPHWQRHQVLMTPDRDGDQTSSRDTRVVFGYKHPDNSGSPYLVFEYCKNGGCTEIASDTSTDGTGHILTLAKYGNTFYAFLDYQLKWTFTDSDLGSMSMWMGKYTGDCWDSSDSTSWWDNLKIRKYTSQEPTTTIGEEEQSITAALYVWNDNDWVDIDEYQLPIFICGKNNPTAPGQACTDSYVIPEYQSDTQPILNLTNIGSNSGDGKLKLNDTLSDITIFCDDDNDYQDAVILSTEYQTICPNLGAGESCSIWCWANFTDFLPPASDVKLEATVS